MRLLLPAVAALCVSTVAAHADTFELFNINGLLNNGATVTGQINIDTTQLSFNNVGSLTYATSGVNSVSASFQGTNNGLGYSTSAPYVTELDFGGNGFQFDLQFPTLNQASFAGFMGGLCTSVSLCGPGSPTKGAQSAVFYNGTGYLFVSGTATPASVTPEPSSIALLGTGMLGAAGVMRRRLGAR